ncbi:hypothetical protein, partial [Aeromonas salmonicida]|uniref:hypothetical protein n=1 Tax=Aeromonas salmonicida TaxID=645 RepID=UPI003D313DE1
ATAIEYGILAAGLAAGILAIFGSDGIFITALKEKFTAIVAGVDKGGAGKLLPSRGGWSSCLGAGVWFWLL